MDRLELEETKFSPHVVLDKDKNIFFIKGRSIPNNASELYDPILEWLKAYSESPNENTEFEVQLEYFNTSTHKFLVEILSLVAGLKLNKKVKWVYEEEDDDLLEIGQRLENHIELKFDFVVIEE